MARRRFWSLGIATCAAAAMAASHAGPVEAVIPPEAAVPAAERVETVLRATYVLPAGQGRDLAAFLTANAVPGIDVRCDQERITVVAPADAQKALGAFIEICLSKEPRTRPQDGFAPPDYRDPTLAPPLRDPVNGHDGFGPATPVRPRSAPRKHDFGGPPMDSFQPS